jgi:hypothetical protein
MQTANSAAMVDRVDGAVHRVVSLAAVAGRLHVSNRLFNPPPWRDVVVLICTVRDRLAFVGSQSCRDFGHLPRRGLTKSRVCPGSTAASPQDERIRGRVWLCCATTERWPFRDRRHSFERRAPTLSAHKMFLQIGLLTSVKDASTRRQRIIPYAETDGVAVNGSADKLELHEQTKRA